MTNKNKHLTYDNRLDIEKGISNGKTFRSIGIELDKDPSTISKEIKRNLLYQNTQIITKTLDGKLIKPKCTLLNKPPYVCNNCKLKRKDCGFDKRFYYAKKAHLNYHDNLVESRRAVVLDKEEFYEMDKMIVNVNLNMSKKFKIKMYILFICLLEKIFKSIRISSYFSYMRMV